MKRAKALHPAYPVKHFIYSVKFTLLTLFTIPIVFFILTLLNYLVILLGLEAMNINLLSIIVITT